MNILGRKKKKLQNAVFITFVLWGAAIAAHGAGIPVPPEKPADAVAAGSIFETPSFVRLLDLATSSHAGGKPMLAAADTGLSDDDAALYKKIFALQAAGDWHQADALLTQVTDDRLRGHVLMQRYLRVAGYHATFGELADWLNLYADLPDADGVYRLALARKPADFTGRLRKPLKSDGISGYLDESSDHTDAYVSDRSRSPAQDRDVARLNRAIHAALTHGTPSRALAVLTSGTAARTLDPVEYDQFRAQIAAAFFYAGKVAAARPLAAASAARSGDKVPLAGWIGGLASWRDKDYKQAGPLFEQAALSSYASDWTAAGSAYWASRAYSRTGQAQKAEALLEQAAAYPHTFYGLIATRALGRDVAFNWDMPELTPALAARIRALPAGRRAMALVASGQVHMAEAELRQINPGNDKTLREALLAYADQAHLPAFAMRMAEATPHPGGGLYDAALYPLSPWQPHSGYTVDRALIHAIIRQESCFDPGAQSHSGATGLMQLMPQTASYMTGSRKNAASLKDPENNMELGQRYVANLLEQEPVSTELFALVVAYNAGPGNLRKWKDDLGGMSNDPLLFIESIPVAETRAFAEKVMSNYWIYRLRLHQPVPSLDSVAGGHWAQYVSIDKAQPLVVADAE